MTATPSEDWLHAALCYYTGETSYLDGVPREHWPYWAAKPLDSSKPAVAPVSAGDVLKPTDAAKRLPWRRSEALAWLRTSGLIRHVEGRAFVIWGDVLDFIRDPTGGGGKF